jgi:hypothetical protein
VNDHRNALIRDPRNLVAGARHHSPVSDADKIVARERREEPGKSITDEDVSRIAETLRAAKQAHSAFLAELCQADVDPVEDWAVWYAEYLLGVR